MEQKRGHLWAELQKIRALHGKERFAYLWDYYKFPFFLTLFLLFFAVSMTVSIAKNARQTSALNCCVLLDDQDASEAWFTEAGAAVYPEAKQPSVSLRSIGSMANEANYYSPVQLMSYSATGEIDLLLCDEVTLAYLTSSDVLLSLAELSGRTEKGSVYAQPEESAPYVCAVDVTGTGYGQAVGASAGDPIYLAIFRDTDHTENAWAMAEYLLSH